MFDSRFFRRATVLAMGLAGLLAVAAPPAAAQELEGLTIGSASVGGDFFVLGTAMQQILAETYPNGKFENSVTAGSVENARLLRRKEIDVGVFTITSVALKDAWNGTGGFSKEEPYTELRNLAGFFHFIYHVITRKDSGIETFEDLKGKRVGIGPDPNINDPTYRIFVDAHGIDYMADLDRVYASYADIFRLTGEGRIDAAITWTSGFKPPASVQEIASAKELRWLPMSREALEGAGLPVVDFPAGSLPHLDEANVAPKYGLVSIAATTDMSDDTAYALVKILHEKFEQFSELQPAIREAAANPHTLSASSDPIPYHPGAIRYWKEVGLWKR
jgi:TRAP transporter TAXI family solute receptor